ncbi:IS982 family transposase [Candidatus Saccharibacteria bacterium]|nr:MAG: IS982 family transposase [Candidatus Saccharibacteria bacterium]QQS70122.1 MAG: IS982 family transposase [Candidatus Saccharibacteria bacterium]
MRELQKQHIVDVYVWVDDTLQQTAVGKTGRPPVLRDSELITILIWDGLTESHRPLKDLYKWIERDYPDYFPKLPKYQNFVAQAHRNLEQLVYLLQLTLQISSEVRFADSTMLPVCKLIRAERHKVAKAVAAFGKNWQGYHYGFKLHASVDHLNRLCAVVFTPADQHDNQAEEQLANEHTRILVGDSHYGGSVQRRRLWEQYKTIVVAPPHYKQRKQVMASWQHLLLTLRPKIEAVFDYLKEHKHLVTSFPRSVQGYFVHYLRVLLGYQMRVVS